ncbi:hypothetical protein CEP54_006609 [Fusarium duplospermum]|uniref:Uncharacterized protein n=1 Tax=Fusarium duplospermum TaxID=1325734 RepID=A0A428Q654_9HYPO|nr:hypothetical protein CEP54_006609 [Fusarium duplospermum]
MDIDQSRIGENRLPTEEAWEAKYGGLDAPYARTFGGRLHQPSGSFRNKTIAPGASVWKVGATSGPTHRTFFDCALHLTLIDDAYVAGKPKYYSEEFVIVGNDISSQGYRGRFCGHGDSGSVVPNHTADYGLVTLIEDVFEDIKASSQGQIEDIRITTYS